MAQDWDIRPRSDQCAGCEKTFDDKEACYSALVFGDEGYVRGDYCHTCWEQKQAQGAAFSTWQGVFHLPPPKAEEAVKKETAESMLRRLMEDDDETKTNVIYILAVMLERKKILVERAVHTDDSGSMTRIYEHRKTGETFVIPEPRLQLDQLEHVQQEVITMLSGGPDQPEKDAEPQAEPATDVADSAPGTETSMSSRGAEGDEGSHA